MVEKIEELRKLCAKEKAKKLSYVLRLYDEIALYLAKILLYTRITANQVSSAGIVFGGLSAIFFAYGSNISLLIAVFFLNFWFICDYCDGKIARYRCTPKGIGGTLDWLNIRVVPHMLFPAVGIGISIRSGEHFLPIIIGVLTAILWFGTWTLHGIRRQLYNLLKKPSGNRGIFIFIGKILNVNKTKGERLQRSKIGSYGDALYICVGITAFTIIDIVLGVINNNVRGIGLFIILLYFLILYAVTLIIKTGLVRNFFFHGSSRYWEKRYSDGGNSGAGSQGKFAKFKAEIINSFVENNEINSVIELGCGDGNQLSLLVFPNYIGLDVSNTALELCMNHFKNDKTKSFSLYEPKYFEDNKSITADLTLSLDVIYHLVEDEIFNLYMKRVFSLSNNFVIIYSSNMNTKQRNHVKHRQFTRWIENNLPEWDLIKEIKNRYELHANFYIYQKEK